MSERSNFEPIAGSTVTHPSKSSEHFAAVIGPYRLLERLGDGGMGEVWLAEQTHPVRRRIALKVIKAGMDTAQVVARFDAERQALALMDHPAIAKVFDGGATSQGRPYFVMEYVPGESLTSYCDRQRLTIRGRLELVLQICDGVQHAHQKGIIHRDLKPSNILVTVQDDHAVPKIIDFGVAKAVAHPLTQQTLYTALTGFVGTLEYMSPEQAEMGGVDIDTRTDVYALGVILYELLTGVLPFDLGKSKGLDDFRRTIREVEPTRPSTRVTQLGPALSQAAIQRQIQPSRLSSALHGDLDWIPMKALEKDRTRRYGSVSEFGADIRRHLHDQPVVARAPTAVYRTRKFVRRHRFGVAAAAGALLLLVSFAVAMTIQTSRVARERDRANNEAAAAKQVSDFLVKLFEVSDPSESRGNTLTAREVLDRGAQNVERTLNAQPDVQARLQTTIGSVYTSLGMYSVADPLLQRALRTNRKVFGDSDPETLVTLHALANLRWFQGRFAEAEPLYRDVLAHRLTHLGDSDVQTLRVSFDLASLYVVQQRWADAESLMTRTLETQRRVLGDDHPDTVASMGNLASLLHRQQRYAEAEPITLRVLNARQRILGADHPETLISMHNVAVLYDRMGRFKEAERVYLDAISGKRRVLGPAHDTTVFSVIRLAEMYARMGRVSEAERFLLDVRQILKQTSTPDTKTIEMVEGALKSLDVSKSKH